MKPTTIVVISENNEKSTQKFHYMLYCQHLTANIMTNKKDFDVNQSAYLSCRRVVTTPSGPILRIRL